MMKQYFAQIGAVLYALWGAFHVYVAWQIYALAVSETGLSQGRLFQLAAYMLIIALFSIVVALWLNWRNDRVGYWLNLSVVGIADVVWVAVVVLPGYVPLDRGLAPPMVFVLAAIFSSLARTANHLPRATSDQTRSLSRSIDRIKLL